MFFFLQVKFLLLLWFLRHVQTLRGPPLPFSFISLNFYIILLLLFWLAIIVSVFCRCCCCWIKSSCYIFDFCEICRLHFFFMSQYFCYFVILAYSCDIYLGVFFVAMKFLVTNMRFLQAFLRFLQAISIEHNSVCLQKLRQKFVRKVLLQLAILIEFVIFAIFALFSIHSWQFVLFFVLKLRKQFATKFLRRFSILDTSGDPQCSITQLFQPFYWSKN